MRKKEIATLEDFETLIKHYEKQSNRKITSFEELEEVARTSKDTLKEITLDDIINFLSLTVYVTYKESLESIREKKENAATELDKELLEEFEQELWKRMQSYIERVKSSVVPSWKESQELKNFLPIMQHNGFFDMIYHLTDSSKGQEDLTGTQFTIDTKTGQVQIKSDDTFELGELIQRLNYRQIQLLCYCIYLRQEQGKTRICLDIKEYFDLREIEKQTNNVNRLLADLQVLERTYFSFLAEVKGKKVAGKYSRVLAVTDIETRKNEVKLVLGEWADTLINDQYSLFHKQFFKYIATTKTPHIVKMSLKLNEISRNNLQRNKTKNSLNVGKLIEFLGFTESTIKAKGFVKACKDVIDNTLDEISAVEGYQWQYRKGEHASFAEYKRDFVEFENPQLTKAYAKYINIKRLNTKKG